MKLDIYMYYMKQTFRDFQFKGIADFFAQLLRAPSLVEQESFQVQYKHWW